MKDEYFLVKLYNGKVRFIVLLFFFPQKLLER